MRYMEGKQYLNARRLKGGSILMFQRQQLLLDLVIQVITVQKVQSQANKILVPKAPLDPSNKAALQLTVLFAPPEATVQLRA